MFSCNVTNSPFVLLEWFQPANSYAISNQMNWCSVVSIIVNSYYDQSLRKGDVNNIFALCVTFFLQKRKVHRNTTEQQCVHDAKMISERMRFRTAYITSFVFIFYSFCFFYMIIRTTTACYFIYSYTKLKLCYTYEASIRNTVYVNVEFLCQNVHGSKISIIL